ncbi:MAG TPA: prepilin-type N-terminal cleavage/methylation domain-containing protein [Chthoniobacteraceae bacterium]|nr:prepilin-type N-terminal cleavage/methylation domain-containing protein [Chthoniobacteraceae bacterium]
MHRPHRNGFGLLEVIVVIALMAIVVALTIPALGRAREGATHLQCAQNLRQIISAIYLYAADHDGSYPPNRSNKDYWDDDHPAGVHHQDRLIAYLPSYQKSPKKREEAAPFWCPADEKRRETLPQHSYGILGARGGGEAIPINRKLAAEPNPSKALYFADASRDTLSTCRLSAKSWPFGKNDPNRPETAPASGVPWVEFRHGGRANILFVDGHVQSFTPQELAGQNPVKINH